MQTIDTDVCVVGGGPGGLTFALALAAQGHDVTVLEKGGSFERSFRGESVAPDSVSALDTLGVLQELRARGVLDVRHMELRDGGTPVLRVDFGSLAGDPVLPIEVPQPMLLGVLTDLAERHRGFQLIRGAAATDLCTRNGRVTGVQVMQAGRPIQIRARLTVGADGRYSRVREWAALPHRTTPVGRDFLWFVVRCPEAWANDTYRIRIRGTQHAMCIPTWPDLVRVGFNLPKGGLRELRASGIGALHARIDMLAPELSDVVRREVVDWSGTGLLDIFTTVVPRWYKPGLVLMGDAAHTLTPVLAQGINHAILDGICLADNIDRALATGSPTELDAACVRFQRVREPAVARARVLQMRQERMFSLAHPVAQAARRTVYRVIDRTPRIKRRIWTSIYQTPNDPATADCGPLRGQ